MARAVNKTVVGILALAIVIVLSAGGYVVVANLPGQDPKRYEADARKFENEEKWAEARLMYTRAYQRDPAKNPSYYVSAARCALEEGDGALVRRFVQLVRQKDIRNTAAAEVLTRFLFEVAGIYGSTSLWNDVRNEAATLVGYDEKSVLGHHALGSAYLHLKSENAGYRDKGVDELGQALELDETNVEIVTLLVRDGAERIRELEVRREKAKIEETRKDIYNLIGTQLAACEAAGEQKKVAELLTLRANTLIQVGEHDKGIKELEEFVRKWPNESLGYRTLGMVLLFGAENPDPKRSEELLRKAVELEPKEGQNYLILGRILSIQADRVAEENAVYEAGLAAVPFSKHFRDARQNFARGQMMYMACMNEVRAGARAEANSEAQKTAYASAEKWIARLSDEQDGDQVSVLLMKAHLLNVKGQLKEATLVAERADRISPTYETKELLGELQFKQQEWGAARKALEAALAADPRRIVPRLQLGQTYLKLDLPALALKTLKPAQGGPLRDALQANQHATTLVMEAYRAQAMYDMAEAENKRLEKMTGDSTGTKLREAQLALQGEKFQEAEEILKSFVKSEKVEPDAARLYVYLLETTERRDDAIKFVNELVAKAPDDMAFLELKAVLDRPLNEPVSEEKILEIINKEKDEFRREMNAFQFWASRAKFDKAQIHLDNAEKLKPDDSIVVERQLLMALNARDWPRASRYADKNRELNADGTQGRIAKGRVAAARGLAFKEEAAKLKEEQKLEESERKSKDAAEQFNQAIEQIKSGLSLYPSYSVGWTNLAEAYLGAERLEDCRNALQRALDLDPTNGLANRAMVQLSINDGDEAAANEFLVKAVKALPNDPYLRQRLEAVEEKKKPSEGIKKREAILAREPRNLQNMVRLAQLYREAEKVDRAAETYESALQLAKDDKSAKVPYIQLVRETAYFYADPKVNRPADGEGLLQEALREAEAPVDKAQLAIFLARFYENQQHISTAERHILMAVSFDTSTSVLMSAAEYFSRNNKLRDAIEYYERAMKSGGVDPRQIRGRLFSLYMALRDYDRAKTEIDNYLKLYPDDKDGRVLLATYHMMGGDIAEAEKALTQELEQHSDNAVALWQRGQLYHLKGRWPQAYEDLSKAKNYKPDSFDYQHRIALADTLLEMGRYDEAITELKTILDKNPQALNVASALADVYFRVKPTRHIDAERLVRGYMAQNSKDERWALLLGRLGALSRNKEQEIEGYTKAAEISEYRLSVVQALFDALRQAKPPRSAAIVEIARTHLASRRLDQSPTVLAALGWAFTEMGDRNKAFEAYDAALSSVGGDFSYHALILMEMCDYYGVDAIYQRAKAQAAEQPDNIVRQKTLLFLLWRNKESDEAIRLSKKIVDQAKDDRDRVFARMALAAFLQKDKKFTDAKLQYEEILKIDPNDIVALNNLACLLVNDMNKPEEGLPYAERATRAAPRDSNILDTMGWALAESNQLGKATTYLLRALEANSDNAAALYHLGMVHLKKGEKPEAELRFVKARDVENRRLEAMRKVINDTVAQLAKADVTNGRVLREADSEILPKIETELGKLK